MKIKYLILLLAFLSSYCPAEIYKWTDKNGVIHYSENKPEKIASEEFIIKTYESVVIENSNKNEDSEANGQKKKSARTRPQKVVMYSAEWCGVCKQAKNYFKKNRIRYTNYDIDKSQSAKKRFVKMGGKGVPVILIGKQRMTGFSAAGFNQIYNN